MAVVLLRDREWFIRERACLRMLADVEELRERKREQVTLAVEDDPAALPNRHRPAVWKGVQSIVRELRVVPSDV